MNKLRQTDEMLERGFLLAYFIHGDKESAIRIVVGAMNKLEVATAAQNKRHYYTPHGRSLLHRTSNDTFRNKISFSKLHLFQRLIYVESEPYEAQKEQAHGPVTLSKDDMLVHYLKHLVRISLKRNSFYVTLSLNRLLYNYSTAETMEIYNLVVQDPERVKDDSYCRSRKGVLLNELKERFGPLVSITRGARGEERFCTTDNSAQYAPLVRECLSFFTPWSTPCLVPAGLDPRAEAIAALAYQGQPKEDAIEVNRIHAILHPECLRRLVEALRFRQPDEKLAVPHFFLSHDEGDQDRPGRNNPHASRLDEHDIAAIKNELAEQAERRRRLATNLLRILVDGKERMRLDLNRSSRARFQLERSPELIEVRAHDGAGELLLASHLLTYNDGSAASQPLKTSVMLEGRRKISINLSFSHDAEGETEMAEVEVSFHERGLFKAALLFARQLKDRLSETSTQVARPPVLVLKPALLLLILTIFIGGLFWILQRRRSPVESPSITQHQGTSDSSPTSQTNAPVAVHDEKSPLTGGNGKTGPSPIREADAGTVKSRKRNSQPFDDRSRQASTVKGPSREEVNLANSSNKESLPARNEQPTLERERTRSLEREAASVSLLEVRKVYIEMLEENPLSASVGQALAQHLHRSDRFAVIENRNEADAVFKISVRKADSTELKGQRCAGAGCVPVLIFVRLVNAKGQVLWPTAAQGSGAKYVGEAAQATAQSVADLLSYIRELSRTQ
ncbi:MAG: hypothetical protein WCF57_05525 [Pyrinomonadaceae bacterium]